MAGRESSGQKIQLKAVRTVVLAIAMAIATAASASVRSDVMEAVHRWTEAFGRQTFNTDVAPCTEDAVVIDDFSPHVWQGSGACSRWFKGFEAWAAKAAVTDAALRLGKIRHLDLDGGFAYLVARITLTYIKAGKSVEFPGTLTMTLRKEKNAWHVSGVAWADP